MRRFIRGGQPGGQRLFIGVKGFDLIEGSLLRLLRSGEANSQRLLIGVKGLNLLEDGLFLFFRGGQPGRQRLFVSVKRFDLLKSGLFLFSAAASWVISACLSLLSVVKLALRRLFSASAC